MAKELCLTPGGPVSEMETECDKKHNDRESAEAIVTGSTNREGPNVVTMRIAVSKSRTARKLAKCQGKGVVTRSGRTDDMRFIETLQAEGEATSGTD